MKNTMRMKESDTGIRKVATSAIFLDVEAEAGTTTNTLFRIM